MLSVLDIACTFCSVSYLRAHCSSSFPRISCLAVMSISRKGYIHILQKFTQAFALLLDFVIISPAPYNFNAIDKNLFDTLLKFLLFLVS